MENFYLKDTEPTTKHTMTIKEDKVSMTSVIKSDTNKTTFSFKIELNLFKHFWIFYIDIICNRYWKVGRVTQQSSFLEIVFVSIYLHSLIIINLVLMQCDLWYPQCFAWETCAALVIASVTPCSVIYSVIYRPFLIHIIKMINMLTIVSV